jgi:hypothetical protein
MDSLGIYDMELRAWKNKNFHFLKYSINQKNT